uniref:EB domain-containing protein n=1 Tax=Panagrolaimus sp. ES5 TaxID=591445 RepID=A0AC34FSB5_9BILA
MCENGVCCPMPVCSQTGQVAMSVCGLGNACPMGYICEGRSCCPEPMPLCPNNGRAIQRCYRGSDCPGGFGCTSLGVCCPLSLEPMCPSRQNAICQCSSSNQCPSQATCNMGTCCTSAVATYNSVPGNRCQHSSQCNGYSSNCATCQQSVCICLKGSYSNGAACIQGTPIILNRARHGCDQYGSPCRFHLSAARRKPLFAPVGNITDTNPLWFNVAGERLCVMNDTEIDPDSTCSYSNGAACIQGTPIILNRARHGCDQYGSPCRFHLSAARRKPLFAPVGNITDTNPLWFNVAGERLCVMNDTEIDPDSTCLPSEKCIDGKCRAKLWPGEYGCKSDLECSSRCGNTYCEEKSDKNVPQCQCRNGMLLYGRCFEKCPRGFHESGAYCMHDDEEAFWENGEAQENLQQLLNDGQC